MSSTSRASRPAQASARAAATCESSIPVTCDTRRSLMPVRDVIHSSSVSISDARSALLRIDGGMHLPQPVIAAYVIASFALVLAAALRLALRSRLGPGGRGRLDRRVVFFPVVADQTLHRTHGEYRALPAANGEGNRADGHAESPRRAAGRANLRT